MLSEIFIGWTCVLLVEIPVTLIIIRIATLNKDK